LIHATSTAALIKVSPRPTKIAHFFQRQANDNSFYFCSIYRCTEDDGVLVTRYGDQNLFQYFLKRTNTRGAFETVVAVAGANTWIELMGSDNLLLEKHSIVFETLPIKITVVHSLDFFDTVEVNSEPMFLDRKILHGYEGLRLKKRKLGEQVTDG